MRLAQLLALVTRFGLPVSSFFDPLGFAEETARQATTLEQLVFVAVPEQDGPAFSSPVIKCTALPVVPYRDLTHEVPDITALLPKVRESGGVVIAFVVGSASEVSERLSLEMDFIKQLPNDVSLHRAFVHSTSYLGYVSIAILPSEKNSGLQERVLLSTAVAQGCLLNCPAGLPDEHVRARTGHELCPNQRSTRFHAALLQGCNITSAFMASGQAPMDFCWCSTKRAPLPSRGASWAWRWRTRNVMEACLLTSIS